MPAASAPSVPGLIGSHSCDLEAEFESRGSTVITVPRATISWKRWIVFGTSRLDESGSQPHTTRQLVFSRS